MSILSYFTLWWPLVWLFWVIGSGQHMRSFGKPRYNTFAMKSNFAMIRYNRPRYAPMKQLRMRSKTAGLTRWADIVRPRDISKKENSGSWKHWKPYSLKIRKIKFVELLVFQACFWWIWRLLYNPGVRYPECQWCWDRFQTFLREVLSRDVDYNRKRFSRGKIKKTYLKLKGLHASQSFPDIRSTFWWASNQV